ncbi:hypothetical protein [Oceanibaculum nanhaiense]|uniref:hypothetical protein n=1 Tax=Oceanibaculum nanhaiense TaxID=1909734 RepID=UPI003F719B87
MAFKPNYNQQRAERNRAKEQKKKEKLLRKEEEVARRKGTLGEESADGESLDGETLDGESADTVLPGGDATGESPEKRD